MAHRSTCLFVIFEEITELQRAVIQQRERQGLGCFEEGSTLELWIRLVSCCIAWCMEFYTHIVFVGV